MTLYSEVGVITNQDPLTKSTKRFLKGARYNVSRRKFRKDGSFTDETLQLVMACVGTNFDRNSDLITGQAKIWPPWHPEYSIDADFTIYPDEFTCDEVTLEGDVALPDGGYAYYVVRR